MPAVTLTGVALSSNLEVVAGVACTVSSLSGNDAAAVTRSVRRVHSLKAQLGSFLLRGGCQVTGNCDSATTWHGYLPGVDQVVVVLRNA